MLAVPSQLGYPVLFALIFGESAGFPLPGETALLTAGVLAGTDRLSLPLVIAVASLASLVGPAVAAALWVTALGGAVVAGLVALVRSRRGSSGGGQHVPGLG